MLLHEKDKELDVHSFEENSSEDSRDQEEEDDDDDAGSGNPCGKSREVPRGNRKWPSNVIEIYPNF